MNFTEKDKALMLIHSQMEYFSDTSSRGINIMLTPQFYTVKRESLPVKYAYQAKRIAPSLFEGLLEDAHNYQYLVIKEDENWLFLSYNVEKIKTFLTSKGINLANISKMYFAEQSVTLFKSPVLLGDKDALVNLEGTMTVIPQIALQADEKPMKIDRSFAPQKGITLEGRNKSFITRTESYILASILTLFSVLYFVEASRYGGESAVQEEKIRLLLENYPSLQSTYTRESIAIKYQTIDTQERKKRDTIKALSHMIFKGSTLTLLKIDDKKFEASFKYTNTGVLKKLKELAKKKKFNTSSLAKNNELKIAGTL